MSSDFKINKRVELIKNFQMLDLRTNEPINYTTNQLKTINYLFYILQKKVINKEENILEIMDAIVENDRGIFITVNNKEQKYISLDIDQSDLKKFLNFNTDNYIPKIKSVLKSFIGVVIEINRENFQTYSSILGEVTFYKKLNQKNYNVSVLVSASFIWAVLKYNNQFAKLNITHIKSLKSKYTIRFYEEFERILQTSNGNSFIKSQENLNKFLGTSFSKQNDLHDIILRMQKELKIKNYYTFTYSKNKNSNKVWIYSLTNIKKNYSFLKSKTKKV